MTIITQPIFLLIFIPLIGVLVILFTNNDKVNLASLPFIFRTGLQNISDSFLYNIALFFSLLNLFVSVVMWYFFNNYNNTKNIIKKNENTYKIK